MNVSFEKMHGVSDKIISPIPAPFLAEKRFMTTILKKEKV